MTSTQDITGVKCGLCYEEAFQLVPREVTCKVGVCPRCARRVDAEQEEQTIQEALKAMEKSERKQFLREQSYEWASKLHGKKVIVYWDDNTHLALTTHYEKHVRGTAYRTTNECGGWGNVKVVIDPAEHHRISLSCHYTLYCNTVECDMFYAPASLYCGHTKCEHLQPVIDGQRFGLCLSAENGSYYTLVSWGCRKCLVPDSETAF